MAEEPCQCSDCQRFYKEHDRLIREFPTFKQQQELNWASIQSFRTLCTKMTDELQKELSEREVELPDAMIGRLQKIASESKDIISLGPGEPDFLTPKPILKFAEKSLKKQ